ncbi:MAG: ABC transporter substrate-binding protein, partial [Chloroflexota bacterium]
MKSKFWLLCLGLLLATLLAACGGAEPETNTVAEEPAAEAEVEEVVEELEAEEAAEEMVEEEAVEAEPAGISGSITVLTNRTDIVDTVFVEYAERFNEIYPDVEVEFEALTDYPGEVKIRMNTTDYGDVLLIPNEITPDQLGDFFTPLGTVDALDQTYNFVTEKAFDGQVYGLPVVGNAQGIVYNKAVFEAAGVTELPTSPDEFIAAMQAISDNTDAIPYYTNYAAGWPLVQWEGNRGSLSCNADYSNELAYTDAPFAEGGDHYAMYKMLYDLAAAGLIEDDPATTDWETSKILLGTGEVASMVLGSWSIVQMQDSADNPDDIGYMPFPSGNSTVCASAGGDWKMGININSPNQDAARAWVDWFLNESGFAADQGGI